MQQRLVGVSAIFLGITLACNESSSVLPDASGSSSGSGQGGALGSATAAGQSGAGQSNGGQNVGLSGQGGAGSVGGGQQSPSGGGGSAGANAGSAGAAGGGGAGFAGASGAASTPSLTLPIVRGELDVLEIGALSFSVNPAKGARITSFKLDGDELLTDPSANPQFWGSTLWTSPASDWVVPGTFVPPPAVDSEPYTTTVSPEGVITATSGSSTAKGKQFVITKTFRANLAKSAIVIDYSIKNNGASAFRLSHWEVTRVFPNGLLFFESGPAIKLDFLKQGVKVQNAQGYTWYDNATHQSGQGESKAGTSSPGGFLAQVAPHAKGDLLFIKAFKPIATTAAPPDHYPIELYCNDAHSYVELEDHSSYDEIAPGAVHTQTVTWSVRRLPLGTDRSVGSAALIAAARAQVD